MIELKNVTKVFNKKEVVSHVDCNISNGVYGLLGPNGAGKTTLMRCITSLYSITAGEILVDGKKNSKQKDHIGYLPQSFGLYKELKVEEVLKLFCSLKHIKRKEMEPLIEESLKMVNLYEKRKVPVKKLSGGMVRRVGIAQAIIGNPKLILFDEPTAGLDPEERINFKRIVTALGKNEAVIISTHIVEDIEASCDKVIVMNKGKLVGVYSCEELAAAANDKVYEVEEKAFRLVAKEKNIYIEKQYEKNGRIVYRVLSRQSYEGFSKVIPTIEDGYMAIIKNYSKE